MFFGYSKFTPVARIRFECWGNRSSATKLSPLQTERFSSGNTLRFSPNVSVVISGAERSKTMLQKPSSFLKG